MRRQFLCLALGVAMALPALRQPSARDLGESALGDPAAPVTIIEYSSLTCPHCASFHTHTLPELKKRYIDTGKARLVLRDFPLDQSALAAAMIAHCAGAERRPQFLEVFFSQQESWAAASDPVRQLKQLAQLGGLGGAEIDVCLADKELETAVLQARLDGQQKYDIRSTPSFIIDGKTYAGDLGVERFAELIEPLLPN